jgi:hypothetical protein
MKPSESAKRSSSPLTFTGTSSRGDLTEAIRNALEKAVKKVEDENVAWTIEKTGGDRLKLDAISVTIRVGPDEGENGGGHGIKKGGGL